MDGGERQGCPARLLAVTLVGCGLLLTACGAETGVSTGDPSRAPEASLSARLAVAPPIRTLDPIYVRGRAELMISRQIHEPLTSRLDRPFEAIGRRRGPARPIGSSSNDTLWEFQLRPGVLFHDGTPLNTDAVIANATRWLASGIADKVIPELIVVDPPRPGVVRFQLSATVPDLPARLADPRLGLVSPADIAEFGTDEVPPSAAGTGPFELRELSSEGALLAGSADWWGREAGLGPGVERLEFLSIPDRDDRIEQLRLGAVDLADGLDPAAARELQRDPLLTTVGAGRERIGIERSVRGIDSASPDIPLSELWLTTLR